MKVATYNLRNLFDPGTHKVYGEQVDYSEEFVQRRVAEAVSVLTKLSADIVIVNELGSADLLDTIAGQLPGGYESFSAKPEPRGIRNGVLYKSGDVKCESILLSPSLPSFRIAEPEIFSPQLFSKRELVHLTTKYAGSPLHVFGLHFKSSLITPKVDTAGQHMSPTTQVEAGDDLVRSIMRRLGEARALRALLDGIFNRDHQAQVIIAGDFNDVEKSVVLRMVQGESESLFGRLFNLGERIPIAQRYTVQSEDGRRRLIDHILVSNSILGSVVGEKIYNENLYTEEEKLNPTGFVQSDHAPILVELK